MIPLNDAKLQEALNKEVGVTSHSQNKTAEGPLLTGKELQGAMLSCSVDQVVNTYSEEELLKGQKPHIQQQPMVKQLLMMDNKSNSDAIHIIPQEHSPTTQQLEAWMASVTNLRKCSNDHDESKISGEIVIPNSPKKNTQTEEVTSLAKAHLLQGSHMQDIGDIDAAHNQPSSQQPQEPSEYYTTKTKVRMDEPMAKTPSHETEVATTIQQQPSAPHIEQETENNLLNVLKKFKEAVTKPLEPCLLQTPILKLFASEEQNEEQGCNPRLKTKLKKQKQAIKITQEVLATDLGDKAPEATPSPSAQSALEAVKNLYDGTKRKKKHKKKRLTVASNTIKKSKRSKKVAEGVVA